jgi:hypothetical protein
LNDLAWPDPIANIPIIASFEGRLQKHLEWQLPFDYLLRKKAARRYSGRLAYRANLKPGYISPVRKMVIDARFQGKV